jgi:hypothetical protein
MSTMLRAVSSIVAILFVHRAAAQTLPADDLAKVMSAFDALDEVAAKKPDLWPGFDLGKTPVAVHQAGGAMLIVGHPSPPVGRQYKTSARVAVLAPSAPECWGVAWASLAGQRTACVELREVLDNPKPARRLAEAAFVAFAGEGIAAPTLAERLEWGEDDAENNGALELEQRLRDEAHTGDPAGIPDRAREWLGVREARRGRLKPAVRKYEARIERAGLGAYVAARAMLGVPADADGVEGRYGRVAAGVGRVLDAIRPGWRAEILTKDEGLEALVRASIQGDARKAAQAARQRLAWPLLLDAAERRALVAGRDRAALWSQVEAAGGIGVLAVEIGSAVPDGARIVDPRGLRRIDAGRRVFLTPVRLDLGARGTLRIARPTAETVAGGRFAVRMPPELKIEADGRPIATDKPLKLGYGRLTIDGEGIGGTLEGGTIEVRDRGVVIRPSRAK